MDQIRKIYEELVSWDPSLSKDKEAVFRAIEKMIAVKPEVIVNPQRKEQFAHTLSEHIARSSSIATTNAFSLWSFNKWAYSFASLFAVMLIIGATYLYNKNSYAPVAPIEKISDNHVAVDHATKEAQDSSDQIESQDNVVRDMYVEQDTNNHNRHHEENQTIGHTNLSQIENDKSTDVDNSSARTTMDSNVGMGGGLSSSEMAPQAMMMSKEASPANTVTQQKKIALVVIASASSDLSTGVVAVINAYDLPITYMISTGGLNEMKLSGNVYNVTEKNMLTIQYAVSERSMLFFESKQLSENVSQFESLVAYLRSQGYLFVNLSSMQQ